METTNIKKWIEDAEGDERADNLTEFGKNLLKELKALLEVCEENESKRQGNCNLPHVIKSDFKCDDVELQPIECEKWRGCFDCPHYKAVL